MENPNVYQSFANFLVELTMSCTESYKECVGDRKERVKEAIEWMEGTPGATQKEAAERAGVSVPTIERRIALLQKPSHDGNCNKPKPKPYQGIEPTKEEYHEWVRTFLTWSPSKRHTARNFIAVFEDHEGPETWQTKPHHRCSQ